MRDQRVCPTHHPSEEMLLDYASGAQREPVALLVATHLAMCPLCRERIGELEAVGGALLEELPPEPVDDDSLAMLLARIERPEPKVEPPPPVDGGAIVLPQPLRGYVGGSMKHLEWRRMGPIAEARLLTNSEGFTTRLLKIKAGTAMPSHTHAGNEMTLVLQGGFSDVTGHYVRGDVAEADSDVDHRPIADEGEDCLCLAVTDAPLRLTSRIGRMLNPFVRI
ncbi:MAG: ChrR family anti-sigma-E factor [Pseudomonadota bacterium]